MASSSSLAAVMSRKSTTFSPRPLRPVQSRSIQRPLASLCVSFSPGSGSGNGGRLPVASSGDKPVSRWAAGFHCRTRPSASTTAMPSALASMTARSCARWRTTSSNAVTLERATLAWPARSSSSSSSMWPTLRLLYSAYSAPYGRPATCDRLSVIVCRPGSAAQMRSSNPPESLVAISTVLPERISWSTMLLGRSAVRPRSSAGSPSRLTSRSRSFSISTKPPASALVSSRRLAAIRSRTASRSSWAFMSATTSPSRRTTLARSAM